MKYTEEMRIKYYYALTKPKHLFKWIIEPDIDNVGVKVSFSLWLTLSFLMSIALYFLAAILSIILIKGDGDTPVVVNDAIAT